MNVVCPDVKLHICLFRLLRELGGDASSHSHERTSLQRLRSRHRYGERKTNEAGDHLGPLKHVMLLTPVLPLCSSSLLCVCPRSWWSSVLRAGRGERPTSTSTATTTPTPPCPETDSSWVSPAGVSLRSLHILSRFFPLLPDLISNAE